MPSLTVLAGVLFLVHVFQAFAVSPPDNHHAVGQSFRDCDALCPEMVVIPPGKFTIYDMSGNAGEWVEDCYHDTYRGAPTDGSPVETCMPKFHDARVMRGGGWNAIPAWMRSASRDMEVPSQRSDSFGFRVAWPVDRD